jgi:dipeptidyl aminopeptidase/acylaminoacyl peptidase
VSSNHANRRKGVRRALLALALLVVVLLPVIGIRVLGKEEPEAVSATGDVTLTPGNRMVYVVEGHVAAVSLADTGAASHGTPVVSALLCARVYAAHGTGLCLRKNTAVSWSATVLDQHLAATSTWPMAGRPALARVSPSGRMVAWTALTEGTSLSGSFAAVTSVVDTAKGEEIKDLSAFSARVGPDHTKVKGYQVWGVTFIDDDSFLATIGVDGHRYLARGRLSTQEMSTIAQDVSNPALSPDGKRVAFVRAGATGRGARLAVMDLASRTVRDLDEDRRVTDQPVWFDARTVGYVVRDAGGQSSVWSTRVGGSRPDLVLDDAESPSPL